MPRQGPRFCGAPQRGLATFSGASPLFQCPVKGQAFAVHHSGHHRFTRRSSRSLPCSFQGVVLEVELSCLRTFIQEPHQLPMVVPCFQRPSLISFSYSAQVGVVLLLAYVYYQRMFNAGLCLLPLYPYFRGTFTSAVSSLRVGSRLTFSGLIKPGWASSPIAHRASYH